MCMRVCVCACVPLRERERERVRGRMQEGCQDRLGGVLESEKVGQLRVSFEFISHGSK